MTTAIPTLRLDRVRRVEPWRFAMAGVVLLAALLRLLSLGNTSTNAFYDAAVRSMGQSWHNLLFAAFEPAAGVAIDKPPLDLWFQVASVKIFGFNDPALILPQALAATIAVGFLFDLVRRVFGVVEATASGLALAVLPLSVVTARSDTMDSLMMALNVIAAWLLVRGLQTGRRRYLLLAGAAFGLSFESKLFEALLAVPGLALILWLGMAGPARTRVRAAAPAVAVFLAVALAWPTLVSLTPSSLRPYPIGSTDGSVWNVIFVYNGLDRVFPRHYGGAALAAPSRISPFAPPAAVARPPVATAFSGNGQRSSAFRLFTLGGYHYGADIGLELMGAILFGGIALLYGALAGFNRFELRRRGPPAAPEAAAAAPEPLELRLRRALAVGLAAWLFCDFVLFSYQHSVLRSRYLEAMTPAIAAALGIGVPACMRLAARSTQWLALTLLAIAATTWYATQAAYSDGTLKVVVVLAGLGGAAAAAGAWAVGRRKGPAVLGGRESSSEPRWCSRWSCCCCRPRSGRASSCVPAPRTRAGRDRRGR